MTNLIDLDIMDASNSIDDALAEMSDNNRGKTSRTILKSLRDLNDSVALKIWQDLYPKKNMGINKAAQQFITHSTYKIIGKLDKFLQKALSHFTPSEDGAERLMIKYYRYCVELKKIVREKYGIDIIKNINRFLEDLDKQTQDYYNKVAAEIKLANNGSANFDIYYIDRIKPFVSNNTIYFEITLEPAEEKPNKFNRVTAFTKYDISSNYAVALKFCERTIEIFNKKFPIKIVTDWQVSIRPCEIENFAWILKQDITIQRGYNEYKTLMDILKEERISLVELIDLPSNIYQLHKSRVVNSTKEKHSKIFDILDHCRNISINNEKGKNILRYLLCNMNNRIIKLQWPSRSGKTYADYNLTSKCMPFDCNPFYFNPAGHIANIYTVLEVVDACGRDPEILAKQVCYNTEQKGMLFTPQDQLGGFGDDDYLDSLIQEYNDELYSGFKPDAELATYDKYIYNVGYVKNTVTVIEELKSLSNQESHFKDYFSKENVEKLEHLEGDDHLDDILKKNILINMYSKSRVHVVYGAAGTGKSTLINHVSNILEGCSKVFLAKTNSAVENLRHRVTHNDSDDNYKFITIDRFTKNSIYKLMDYDIIVVDECSTVKNEEILKILNMLNNGILILVGDTYQIEAIGYGSWFNMIKNVIPSHCCHELLTPFRSSVEHLKELWKEVRNMSDENLVLEEMVRSRYSNIIDDNIFNKKADDEIILCLNYNGLYGLNNINKLLQLGNPNPAVKIGIWEFKKGDPILFNDSERFDILYNNLKGKIIDIEDKEHLVFFTVEVDIYLSKNEVESCEGLEYIANNDDKTVVRFFVNRRPPYFYDYEPNNQNHIMPFQVAYAVSIHKSQGLEYDSVKIVIADESEDKINHNIFYTAITRAKKELTIFWSPEVCNRILARIRPQTNNKDFNILKNIYKI